MATLNDPTPDVNPAAEDHAALWHDTLDAVAAFEPTEADQADYIAWCRQRDERLLADRVAGDEPPFRQKIADVANALRDQDDPTLAWIGEHVARLYDLAVSLEATSPEQYEDRLDVMRTARDW